MFQSLFRRAEATVDQVVTGLAVKLVVAIPFVVALGFATAAATIYVNREFGSEVGYLIMTGVFVVIGGLAWIVAATRTISTVERTAEPAERPDATAVSAASPLDSSDRELLTAAVTAIGPIAAPALLKLVVRNLPLLTAIAAAGFVLTRSPDTTAHDGLGLEPAE